MKKIAILFVAVLMMFSMTACTPSFLKENQLLDVKENPTATFTISYEIEGATSVGPKEVTLTFELLYDKAPSTVTNFINLAEEKFYDGQVIHAATAGGNNSSSLQTIGGGKYTVNDEGQYVEKSKNYSIIGEFEANGWEENDLTHIAGMLGMARDDGEGDMFNTGSTEFYMTLSDGTGLGRDGNYALFGEIVSSSIKYEGMTHATSLADGLNATFVDDMLKLTREQKETPEDDVFVNNAPVFDIKVVTVKIDDKGIDFSKGKVVKV